MFSHVHVGIADFAPSFGFYSIVLGALDLEVKAYQPEQSWAAWGAQGTEGPLFFIGLPFDRKPAASGNGHMTAFLAATRAVVDRCHAAALAKRPPLRRPSWTAATLPRSLLWRVLPGPGWK
jgi:catechol 2,3-dioxygenase-like lactoylglutathione lyase family enzyme